MDKKQAQSNASIPEDAQVFPVKPLVAGLALLGLALLALVPIIMLLVFLFGGEIRWRDLLILPALVPPALILVYFVFRSAGAAVLTADEVIFIRFRMRRSLRYDEIKTVKEKDLHLPPNLVLLGARGQVRINRWLQDFPRFYQQLAQRVACMQAHKHALPFKLQLRTSFIFWNAVGFLAFGFFLLIVFVLMVIKAESISIYFIACSIDLLIFSLIVYLFLREELQPEHPVEWIFMADQIQVRYLFGAKDTFVMTELGEIELKNQLSLGYPHPAVVLHLLGDQKVINLRRARQFGYEPEQLILILRDLYPRETGSLRLH